MAQNEEQIKGDKRKTDKSFLFLVTKTSFVLFFYFSITAVMEISYLIKALEQMFSSKQKVKRQIDLICFSGCMNYTGLS